MDRTFKMNYRKAYLDKKHKNIITRKIKKMNLDEGEHTIKIDVGKTFKHIIELVVVVAFWDDWKKNGVDYEYVRDVYLYEAKFIEYQTSVGTTIPEKKVGFGI